MPRRHDHLFSGIASFRALHEAAERAIGGKRQKPGAASFMANREKELLRMERELNTGSWRGGGYTVIEVREPKPRRVSAWIAHAEHANTWRLRHALFRGGWFDPQREPDGPPVVRVLRGGSWNNKPQNARAANRNRNEPANRNNNNGFRLASTPSIARAAVFKDMVGVREGIHGPL